jgi:hypothetical protein
MGSRSIYVSQIDELEAAVIGFGRRVAGRRPVDRVGHHRAVGVAIETLRGSPFARPSDRARIHAMQDVDFHVRHVDRLLESLGGVVESRADVRSTLAALDRSLAAFADRDIARLDLIDRALQRILERVERPLLRDRPVSPAVDARVRRVALHVLAVAEAARLAAPSGRTRPPATVA